MSAAGLQKEVPADGMKKMRRTILMMLIFTLLVIICLRKAIHAEAIWIHYAAVSSLQPRMAQFIVTLFFSGT